MASKKTNRYVLTLVGTTMGVILALTTVVEAQPTGRLLVPGPADGAGSFLNTIHEYDLATREMTTFGPPPDQQFPQNPVSVTMCPDGLLYVALGGSGGVYKLDPVTGETLEVLAIPTGRLLCLPNGNLLLRVGGGADQ